MKSELLGSWTFADAWRLEQGLDALFEVEPDAFYPDIDDIEVKGLVVRIYYDDYEDRPRYPTARAKVEALARFVVSDADRSRPRHHRYELYFATRDHDIARLRELVALGAEVNGVVGRHKKTSLHEAARWDTTDAVDVLLAAGANVHAATSYGWTPLRGACRVPVVRALIAAGADPSTGSLTTLEDVVWELLAAGAKPRPEDYREIANTCAALKRIAIMRELVARAPDFRDALADENVARKAIASRDPVTLDFILEQGASLPDNFLAEAIYWGVPELVAAALRAPDAAARCGLSSDPGDAMCRAAAGGDIAIMQLLADHGVPLHPATRGVTTPFAEAASHDRVDALAWLLERGVPYDEDVGYRITTAEAAMFFIDRGWDPAEAYRADLSESEEKRLGALLAARRSRCIDS